MEVISCSNRNGVFQKFGGATDRGISMDSTLADVKRVYGEPTSTFEAKGAVTVVFKELGLNFSFAADGKVHQIMLNRRKAK